MRERFPFEVTRFASWGVSQNISQARALALELDEEEDAIHQVNEAEKVGTNAIMNRILLKCTSFFSSLALCQLMAPKKARPVLSSSASSVV